MALPCQKLRLTWALGTGEEDAQGCSSRPVLLSALRYLRSHTHCRGMESQPSPIILRINSSAMDAQNNSSELRGELLSRINSETQ